MAQTKIEWTDQVWNMVWGCKGCYLGERCYAKKIAKRFAHKIAEKEVKYMGANDNDEHWIEHYTNEISQFNQTYLASQSYPKFPAKPRKIFANSMSDIAFWLPNWIKDLINVANKYPQHTFQVLTKFAVRLKNLMKGNNLTFPQNVWLGLTVTEQSCFEDYWYLSDLTTGKIFVSVEPILERIDLKREYFPLNIVRHVPSNSRTQLGNMIDWIIIGVETGSKVDKLNVVNNHINSLIQQAKYFDIPVFVKSIYYKNKVQKDNFPKNFSYREFPKE